MDSEANSSFDSNHGSTNDGKHDARKQQFTTKQRIDMYAFCVLELELHGNTVSIKKQQQAIQRALKKEQIQANNSTICSSGDGSFSESNGNCTLALNDSQNQHEQQQTQVGNNHLTLEAETNKTQSIGYSSTNTGESQEQSDPFPHQQPNPPPTTSSVSMQLDGAVSSQDMGSAAKLPNKAQKINSHNKYLNPRASSGNEYKTLLELEKEVAKTQRCYSDYQKTRVLTSYMLREVQKRFARYYPDKTCPSRTTIKHVFMKCVENGTVENVKNPRKPTKIPNGEQIEQFLNEEPLMSLREMAKKLNVSTGTVSRRCKALGIVPESVTLKHQQMAMAKRQKQLKHTNAKTRTPGRRSTPGSSRQNQATSNHHEQSHYTNGMV